MTYPSLAGQLRDFELPQVFSVLEYSRMTGVLRVNAPEGRGMLWLEEGHVVGAEAGAVHGELAVYSVLSWPEGSFSFTKEQVSAPRQELGSSQAMVLEAARLLDECRSPVIAFARTGVTPGPECLNGARRILAAVSGPTSIGKVASSCSITSLEAYFHLEKLEGLRAVSRCAVGASREVDGASRERRTRILVVDDSPLMQRVLTRIYETDPRLTVVGTALNGNEGLHRLRDLRPDLVSLDLYMPVMDGPTTLRNIMLSQPTPTVVVTGASPEALDLTFESMLRYGAIDFITKPSRARGDLAVQTAAILKRVRTAARVNLRGLRMVQPPAGPPRVRATLGPCQGVIVAAAGTGACLSYMQFVPNLPHDLPFAVVGFVPLAEDFLGAFATYLTSCAPFDVRVASGGDRLQAGVCYLIRADRSARIVAGPGGPFLSLGSAPGLAGGSVSPLMADAARLFGPRSVGLVLSGDGDEALAGLAAVRAAEGITLAQLPASSVDPGQCERAIEASLVDRVVLPNHISGSLSQLLMSRTRQNVSEAMVEEEGVTAWPENVG